MSRILKYLLDAELNPRSGKRPRQWIENDIARHYVEILHEEFNVEATHSNRSSIVRTLKRLSKLGFIEERERTSQYVQFGKKARYWKLTEMGKKEAKGRPA